MSQPCSDSPRIGWIGLGHMGGPMTANLRKAGFAVSVFNRTRAKAEGLGLPVAESPAALAAASDIIITMLADDASQDDVLFGAQGVLHGVRAGQILINMGTMSPQTSRDTAQRFAALGVSVIDAPVSGSVKPATDGTLVILAGGETAAIAQCQPIFDAVGKRTFHFGPAGQGASAKLSINMLLGSMLQATAESLVFGEALGLDRGQLLDMIAETPCASPIFGIKSPALRARDYPPAFPLKHMAKDFRLALSAAQDAKADHAIPAAATVSASYQQAVQAGLGDLDVMAVIKVLEQP